MKSCILLGTFDLFHRGHVALLARYAPNILRVGVCTDQRVWTLKGRPPVQPYRERALMAAAILELVQPGTAQVVPLGLNACSVLSTPNPAVAIVEEAWRGRFLELLDCWGVDQLWWKNNPNLSIEYAERTPGISTSEIRASL